MAPRRLDPRLVAAFERAQVAPEEPLDFDTPGRVVEVPVPAEHFAQPQAPAPKSRLDVVREYLEAQGQAQAPDFGPDVDVDAAREQDSEDNVRAGLRAVGQAFLGDRMAPYRVQQGNAAEKAALAERAARRKALADWAATQDKRRLDEAELLSRAASQQAPVDRTRELDIKQQGVDVQRESLDFKREMANRPKAPKAPKPGEDFKDSSALRKEFDSLPEVKAFKDVSIGMDKIRTAAKSGTAPGDMALIFAFMKILDPGSSVKEGEYASAKNAQGVPDKVRTAFNNAKDGQILSPAARAEFLKASEELYESERARYSAAAQRYRTIAEKKGLAADDVALDRPAPPAPKSDAGKVTIEDPENPGTFISVSPALAEKLRKRGGK